MRGRTGGREETLTEFAERISPRLGRAVRRLNGRLRAAVRTRGRRRAAAGAAVLALLALVATALPPVLDRLSPSVDPASSSCVRDTAEAIRAHEVEGHVLLHVTVREKRVPVSDGVARGYGFRAVVRASLSRAPRPAGTVTVWDILRPRYAPEADELVLLLFPQHLDSTDGQPLFGLSEPHVYEVRDGDRVVLDCPEGEGTAPLDALEQNR
ncbi:hypothetical protein GCM10009801_10460 [Streptomyces albiaxialis]|uniref:Uncharacterized protein n=1 Tax=Streptomyces albiaxialis TaxID=329523 RepID=A0ABP5H6B6_9ACTN